MAEVITVFTWRHKILDTLDKLTKKTYLTGTVEADETFFNYKSGIRILLMYGQESKKQNARGGIMGIDLGVDNLVTAGLSNGEPLAFCFLDS